MFKCFHSRFLAPVIAGSLLGLSGLAHASNDTEAMLRSQMQLAAWPSSAQQQAEQYLQAFPDGPAASQALAIRERAQKLAEVLSRREVGLYRPAVLESASNQVLAPDVHAAMSGDAKAAMRLAEALKREQPYRYVGWLQLATALGNEHAAYDLALFFRAQGQPAMAAMYETQAVSMGFVPPPVLDHSRK
jgi:hypothetical protein